jgi:capsular exopolysaccharide synthesis family protein
VEFSDYIRVLRRSWVLLLATALVGTAAAGVFAYRQTPLYTSDTTVVLTLNSAGSINDALTGQSYIQSVVTTYADIANQPLVLTPVRKTLGLTGTLTNDQLAKELTITASNTSQLIGISVEDSSPARAARIANAIAAQMAKSVEEISPARKGAAPVKLSVSSPAEVAKTPSTPNIPLMLAIGFVGGLALALIIAILRNVLDTRIRRPEDAQAVTDRPVLGGIARSNAVKKNPLVVRSDPNGRLAEEFRTLRTNLQFLDVDRSTRTMVISSSTEGEGKTTTAVNLSLAMADAGADVLIIDADLRRPRLADVLRIDGGVGLTDVLIDRVRLDDALQSWGDGHITVLPAGAIPPNPSELLQSEAMEQLLETLQGRFSTIVLDAPPLLPVSDAAILSHRVSGTIMVCAARHTTKGQLADAVDKVQRVGGRVLGVVLTKLPVTGADASSYVKYEYTSRKATGRKGSKKSSALKAREV